MALKSGKFKNKVQAELVSGENWLPGSSIAIFSLTSSGGRGKEAVLTLFYEDTDPTL